MFVHSGSGADTYEMEMIRKMANKEGGSSIKFANISSSTSSSEIEDGMIKSRKQNLPLILFSTYHSCDRIEIARAKTGQNIRMMINDEAHYLVQEEFHTLLSKVQAEIKYFFTATARFTPSDKGRGMNNKEKYGEIVYEMTPREAIERGKMVRPRIHTFFSPDVNTFEDFQKSIPKVIENSFIHHEEVISDLNYKAKILVSAKGVGDIEKFLESKECKRLQESDVNIFAVASTEEVGNRVNDKKVNRKQFLKELKGCGENPDKKMIVLHYDILAEGIDVSGFTGILPLRTLSKSKFLQTYGRTARLHPEDREAFSKALYKPNNISKLKKPFAYVLIPNLTDGNEDDYYHLTGLINEMRDYDFSCIENIITTEIKNGVIEPEVVDGYNDPEIKLKALGNIIKKIESELEDKEIASLKKFRFARMKRSVRKKKAKDNRKIRSYEVFNSKKEAKERVGTLNKYCLTCSKNNAYDIASSVLNKTKPSSHDLYYYVDGPSESHEESWSELKEKHPEYIGKYLVPEYE